MQDNSHPILVADIPQQRVFVIQESELKDGKVPADFKSKKTWGFAAYIALKKDPRC